jgi:chaperonin GroEL
VLPGGGVALLRMSKILDKLQPENHDQRMGVDIVRRALQSPTRQIVENAGHEGSVVVGKILEKADFAYGYDAQNDKYGDLMKAGIIDPTKVVRASLQDAASVAGLLITTEAMVADKPEKKEAAPAGGMPPGGMGDMGF